MKITRRNFINGVAAGTFLTLMDYKFAWGSGANKKIVVLGGGYGGSTAAKYLKKIDPSLDVTMVARDVAHVSCVLSNEVIVGLQDPSYITFPHKVIADKYGVKFVQAEVLGLDASKKLVKTSAGELPYDKLIVSPGISMDYAPIDGFDKTVQQAIPHAWIGGPQTLRLREMLKSVKKGSTILIRTPKVIYRCPPGPYERISLISNYAQKRGAKVVVLDPNPQIASKAPLFKAAFEELYADTLTYLPGTAVLSFDKPKKTIVTDKGRFTADVINFIPDQKAGEMAFALGLVPKGEKWAPVSPTTFESKIFKDVYVIGDAIDSSITEMPKSGTIANGMAKIVAENIVRGFAGEKPAPLVIGNSCYSLVSDKEGIYIATVYAYDPAADKIVVRNQATQIPPSRSVENHRNQESWGLNIVADTFS